MLKNNLGFLLIDIDNNDHYDHILTNIKLMINNNPYDNIVIFNSTCNKINTYNIPILHLSHAKFFHGDLILFDLMGVIVSKYFTNISRKFLYCDDMPWLKNRNNSYFEWQKIYGEDLSFITTNQYLYDIYNICWRKPVGIMETFDYEKIQNIL